MLTTSHRYMYNADGTFNHGHINNWQHAAMYFAYMVAGIVDLAAYYSELPPDSEQVGSTQCVAGMSCCPLYPPSEAAVPWLGFLPAVQLAGIAKFCMLPCC